MSIQEQPVHYDIPEQKSSSSIVIHRGNEEYDPFANDDDDQGENEQLIDNKHQKQESIRTNNGTMSRRVVIITNSTANSDKYSSLQTNDQQQSRRKSKSPVEHHRKHSDRRSRSPYHRNHSLPDRKRLRTPPSSDTSIAITVNNNDSSTSDIISSSSSRYNKTYRKDSKHHYRHRSPSPKPSSTSNKKLSNSKDDKSFNSSDNNNSNHRSSKRDDYHSYRYDSSRNHHSYSSSKYPSRDYPSSVHQSHNDRRTLNSKISDVSRIPSVSDGNSSHQNIESNDHETSTEDRNRTYSRFTNSNDPIHTNNSNKTSPSESATIGSQISRSDSIQTDIKEASPILSKETPQTKPDPIESLPIPAKIDLTTNTNGSSKSIEISKTNGSTADDMIMEEMLLEEENEQIPVKTIDLDSLTIPEISTEKIDIKDEPIKIITTTTMAITSIPSLTPSPTKKPYTLYKVPHTNHMTPPLSSRHKKQIKKDASITQSDPTPTTHKSSTDENTRRTSLDERISNILGVPVISPTKPTNSSIDQQSDNPPIQTTSTPSDKSAESPQDVTLLISSTVKKEHDHSSLTKKLNINEERRSTTSKHYTSEWLASQKPEEAQTEEFNAPPSLIILPTLISSQSSVVNTGEAAMLGKLSEAMSKLIQKQNDTNIPTAIADVVEEVVPISAKHLERIERKKQREKRQNEIVAIAKEALKPAFKKHDITKDEYKAIMKKVVTKAMYADEVDRKRIRKMIDAYVDKYRTLSHRSDSKISTIANGNG